MANSASGAWSNNSGTGTTTLTVVTPILGSVRTLICLLNATQTVSTVTGGGVTTWKRGITVTINGVTSEIWMGQVDNTASAPTTVTIGWSSSISSTIVEYASQMFLSGKTAPLWQIDNANSNTGTARTALTWPNLVPTRGNCIYVGCSFVGGTGSPSSTSGFTSITTSNDNVLLYNPNVAAGVAPTATQTPSSNWSTVGLLIAVTDLGQFFPVFGR